MPRQQASCALLVTMRIVVWPGKPMFAGWLMSLDKKTQSTMTVYQVCTYSQSPHLNSRKLIALPQSHHNQGTTKLVFSNSAPTFSSKYFPTGANHHPKTLSNSPRITCNATTSWAETPIRPGLSPSTYPIYRGAPSTSTSTSLAVTLLNLTYQMQSSLLARTVHRSPENG